MPAYGWTVECFGRAKSPSLYYVAGTRRDVWKRIVKNLGGHWTPRTLYRAGWRVRKCVVTWA